MTCLVRKVLKKIFQTEKIYTTALPIYSMDSSVLRVPEWSSVSRRPSRCRVGTGGRRLVGREVVSDLVDGSVETGLRLHSVELNCSPTRHGTWSTVNRTRDDYGETGPRCPCSLLPRPRSPSGPPVFGQTWESPSVSSLGSEETKSRLFTPRRTDEGLSTLPVLQ